MASTIIDCPVHGPAVPATKRRDGRKPVCGACAYDRLKRRRQAVKRILVEEAGGSCVICGYDRCLRALEFHHRDPSAKTFSIAANRSRISLERLREEAMKCVL